MSDHEPLLRPPETFLGLPLLPPDALRAHGARAAIVGVPFDCGIHPFRVGAREGPAAVRHQSRLIRRFHPLRG
ncbi:MAG: arginase family protein, partial [Acetobacteraceae bacterium]